MGLNKDCLFVCLLLASGPHCYTVHADSYLRIEKPRKKYLLRSGASKEMSFVIIGCYSSHFRIPLHSRDYREVTGRLKPPQFVIFEDYRIEKFLEKRLPGNSTDSAYAQCTHITDISRQSVIQGLWTGPY